MTDHKARPEPWQEDAARWLDAILELRARVQLLEDAAQKHIVETSANILALASRVEPLEAAQKLPKQMRVKDWYEEFDCARSSAYKWLADLGIRPLRKVNKATGKVESWLTEEQAAKLTGYAKTRYGYSDSPRTHEINEPLKLTPEQAQQVRDLLAPELDRNYPAKPDSSLMGRVAIAISQCEDSSCWDDEAVNWTPEARAAIREVAVWLRENYISGPANVIEQEAER